LQEIDLRRRRREIKLSFPPAFSQLFMKEIRGKLLNAFLKNQSAFPFPYGVIRVN
jgi:hypothetical protein